MPDQTFDEERKGKQSIRRKSSRRKSRKSSRRQSKRQSRRQSRKQSRRQSRRSSKGVSKSKKFTKSVKDSLEWDDEELGFGEVMTTLHGDPLGESPIDLELRFLKKVTSLPPLQWFNTENLPYAMKMANTGCTATITGLWPPNECPRIRGGPLKDDYDFSQVHFHWGESEKDGSEHLANHQHYPFEVHAVFHKSSYGIHERARKEIDGLIVVVYMYTLSKRPNMKLDPFICGLADLISPLTEIYVDPFKYSSVFPVFDEDYILYNGWMKHRCQHATLWFICRKTLGINNDQLERFRKMIGAHGQPILKNYRDAKDVGTMNVFIVQPSLVDKRLVLHPRPVTPDDPKSEEMWESEKNNRGDKKQRRAFRRQSKRSSVRRQSKRQSKGGKRQSMKRNSRAGSRKSLKK